MAIMEISVVPLGTGKPSVSDFVAGAIKALEGMEGLAYELCPMGTVIQSDSLDKLFAAAKKMHESVLAGGALRVVTSIKIDDRKDKALSMDGKLRSLKEKLGR